MRPIAVVPALALILAALAPAARADTRLLAYDASDRLTQALTQGVTLEVERGLFGAIAVRRILPTTARGAAVVERGGPDAVRHMLPEGAERGDIYTVPFRDDGRALVRALCPAADEAWLVVGRVRPGRPLSIHAVGRWVDGRMRHCVTLSYAYRGEWAAPPRAPRDEVPAAPASPRG